MAGSTNFLQHNPSSANQENDATYAADNTRTSGIGVDQIMPSDWMNKIWYQCTTFVAAFCQMMANKGYNMSDANIVTLTNVLANVFTNADQRSSLQVVPFSPTAGFLAGLSNGFQMTLSGNANNCAIAGWSPGQIITFILIQDGVGGRTFNIPGVNGWPIAINPAPNSVSILQIVGRADGSLWPCGQELLFIPYVQNGTGVGQTGAANTAKIGWSGTRLKATVDGTDLGNIVFDSQLNPVSAAANAAQASINSFAALFNSVSFAGNGFAEIPLNGQKLIIQWGSINMGSGDTNTQTANFPIVFPHACLQAFACTLAGGSTDRISFVNSFTASGVTISNNGSGASANWFAIGW